MSAKVLFACSKCFSRHPFEELSSGQQLCKSCRGSTSVVKCTYCRSEFQPSSKSQSACKKCEHNLNKYGKPNACECCKIVAAFGGPKCMRCASYEAKYGPPVQCDECKQRSAFDKHDENKKVNGKFLCWLCTSAFKRALIKAQQEGRISSKKRPHDKSLRDGSGHAKKSSRSSATDPSKAGGNSLAGSGNMTVANATTASNTAALDFPDKMMRSGAANSAGAGGAGNSNSGNGPMTVAAPALVTIDPNSTDHMVAMTNLKERIASLEKRLQQKDKELLEKEKLLTELKGKNFEKENEMRNKLKEVARLNEMRIENLNRKVASLLKEIAGLKKSNKKNGSGGGGRDKDKGKDRNIENVSPKEESRDAFDAKEEKEDSKDVQKRINDIRDDKDESNSVGGSSTSSPSIN